MFKKIICSYWRVFTVSSISDKYEIKNQMESRFFFHKIVSKIVFQISNYYFILKQQELGFLLQKILRNV